MPTTPAFRGLACTDCGESFPLDDASHRCPDCGGLLEAAYDHDAAAVTADDLAPRHEAGLERYADLLPVPADALVSMNEGATPLVACSTLAEDIGVGRVLVKDEGRNPTGSVRDREMAVAVTAAAEAGATDVGLPTTGNGGQAMAAYAARAGLDSHTFAPSRMPFLNKAMINVHGGDMSVGEGRYGDSARVYAEEAENDWYALTAFETPVRQEGAKTLAYEIAADLDWTAPDAVVTPVGHGITLTGLHRGFRDLHELDIVDGAPALYATQAAGCAPIVEAFTDGLDEHEPVERPDTICGALEVADPTGSPLVIDAVRETDGGAVESEDRAILEAAVSVAETEGLELGAAAGAAVSGARKLAEDGPLGANDTVVVCNPATGNKDNDILRSHLMSKGI
ncbi:threonine synthase [Halorientalis marina]|uniref:threonine synthase n=1 Tax=Halorientalis marina TaxID=2931976 RepID=UPI001FF5BDF7|nr:threonine synthase [Halorientalis marina]